MCVCRLKQYLCIAWHSNLSILYCKIFCDVANLQSALSRVVHSVTVQWCFRDSWVAIGWADQLGCSKGKEQAAAARCASRSTGAQMEQAGGRCCCRWKKYPTPLRPSRRARDEEWKSVCNVPFYCFFRKIIAKKHKKTRISLVWSSAVVGEFELFLRWYAWFSCTTRNHRVTVRCRLGTGRGGGEAGEKEKSPWPVVPPHVNRTAAVEWVDTVMLLRLTDNDRSLDPLPVFLEVHNR